ncbi:uncharacterized protein STEHIDRAFT_119876 [Stereum hirsutum FP-91666 SS1]|uniref:uncharacterized protein n=1 Tax=Stereum hirsutum (strain FP-91666) TaxID=721885 RepID=UPI000440F17B|nr:uncharacterized protein STEHIDRAFT_119876 [Stereum hirsutum FP-91666 SS1]EIM89132.1 hypothetical protein STEHIDRAFT_119876 [Stereum hirsutum FP-91666 SS1]
MSHSPHSRRLALAMGASITLSIGALYYAGLRSKAEDQDKSIGGGRDVRVNDNQAMNSSDVREAMHKTRGT